MRKFWAQPLRRQLLVSNLLLLIPVIGLAVWSSLATMRERRQELGTQSQLIATTTAAFVNRDVINFDRMAQSLSGDPSVQALNASRMGDLLPRAMVGRPALLDIVLTDLTGKVVARADPPRERIDADGWSASVIRRTERTVNPVSGTGRSPGGRVVFAYPVKDHSTGRVVGALGMFVNLRGLQDAFSFLQLPASSLVTIADEDGRILAQNVEAGPAGRFLYGERRTAPGPHGPAARVGSDNVNRLHAEAMADAGPWVVNVGVPMAVALEGAMVWTRSFSVLAIGLAGCFLMAWFLSRRLGDSVSHLDAAAQRIAAGDFSPMQRKPMLSAEFAKLQAAFDGMLQRFNATRDVARRADGGGAADPPGARVAAGPGDSSGASGRRRPARLGRRPRDQQSAAGHSRLLRAPADADRLVRDGEGRPSSDSEGERPRLRHHSQSRALCRQQPGEAAPVMMSDVIRAVAELRQRRLETEDIELHLEDRAEQSVKAVLTELQQVVLNFVVNAEQAILSSGRLPGRITIRTYDKEDHLVLEVEDTGPGIPLENEAKLFQPFFTTKPVGQGTGLGLSISYGIIDSLGGGIGYRRAPAGGSIFYFDLPAVVNL